MVIHGDLSINNIMINRIFDHEPDKAPSELRKLACAKADAQSDSDPTAQSDLASDVAPAVEPTAMQSPGVQSLSAAGPPSSNVANPSSPGSQSLSLSPDLQPSQSCDSSALVSEGCVATPAHATPAHVSPVDKSGTLEAIESSGMVIDFDFMRSLDQDTYQTSVRYQCFGVVKYSVNISILGNLTLHGN